MNPLWSLDPDLPLSPLEVEDALRKVRAQAVSEDPTAPLASDEEMLEHFAILSRLGLGSILQSAVRHQTYPAPRALEPPAWLMEPEAEARDDDDDDDGPASRPCRWKLVSRRAADDGTWTAGTWEMVTPVISLRIDLETLHNECWEVGWQVRTPSGRVFPCREEMRGQGPLTQAWELLRTQAERHLRSAFKDHEELLTLKIKRTQEDLAWVRGSRPAMIALPEEDSLEPEAQSDLF